eukprot:TRINITY_DN2560_c0_g1_i4.p1 TRINITY_DN2560_c0_g1~~TRINITY_DN2560_c0_g1_i4.p1  ORF type:complete len:296 (-),score=81.46 TRINITY_DN2560_c0_g1_i4:153-1040(-)
MPYNCYGYFYSYSCTGPSTVTGHPEAFYRPPRPVYVPPTPSYRIYTPGHNADYAREYYSHLTRVNSPDTTVDYKKAYFFIIKSLMEDNVHRSMKYQAWSSTPGGNKRLHNAYLKAAADNVPVFLFFSVNGSRQFVGVARMSSKVNFRGTFMHWKQDKKWLGKFDVEWIFIKDIPNKELKLILVPDPSNYGYKSVTKMKDAQEIPFEQGMMLLEKFKSYKAETSILDGFEHYDNEERKDSEAKAVKEPPASAAEQGHGKGRRRGRGRGKRREEKSGDKKEGGGSVPASEMQAPINK